MVKFVIAKCACNLLRLLSFPHGYLSPGEWSVCGISFSQFGEDALILALLGKPAEREVFVDIGAFHPVHFSNTLLLAKHGWKGVNIDANRQAVELFRQLRPGDRNVLAAVSDRTEEVLYCEYGSRATNRICSADDTDLLSVNGESPAKVSRVKTVDVNELLAKTIADGERIGFLNIDVEGMDLRLVRRLNWDRFRPRVVAVEAHGDEEAAAVTKEMSSRGFRIEGRLRVTLLFVDDRVLPPGRPVDIEFEASGAAGQHS